jgi:hypothetical protein
MVDLVIDILRSRSTPLGFAFANPRASFYMSVRQLRAPGDVSAGRNISNADAPIGHFDCRKVPVR